MNPSKEGRIAEIANPQKKAELKGSRKSRQSCVTAGSLKGYKEQERVKDYIVVIRAADREGCGEQTEGRFLTV